MWRQAGARSPAICDWPPCVLTVLTPCGMTSVCVCARSLVFRSRGFFLKRILARIFFLPASSTVWLQLITGSRHVRNQVQVSLHDALCQDMTAWRLYEPLCVLSLARSDRSIHLHRFRSEIFDENRLLSWCRKHVGSSDEHKELRWKEKIHSHDLFTFHLCFFPFQEPRKEMAQRPGARHEHGHIGTKLGSQAGMRCMILPIYLIRLQSEAFEISAVVELLRSRSDLLPLRRNPREREKLRRYRRPLSGSKHKPPTEKNDACTMWLQNCALTCHQKTRNQNLRLEDLDGLVEHQLDIVLLLHPLDLDGYLVLSHGRTCLLSKAKQIPWVHVPVTIVLLAKKTQQTHPIRRQGPASSLENGFIVPTHPCSCSALGSGFWKLWGSFRKMSLLSWFLLNEDVFMMSPWHWSCYRKRSEPKATCCLQLLGKPWGPLALASRQAFCSWILEIGSTFLLFRPNSISLVHLTVEMFAGLADGAVHREGA